MDKRTIRYIKEYKWSNILAMLKNNNKDAAICPESFKNKLVIITGATSGIGYSTAHKFASMGANLLCINRNIEKSENLQREIVAKYGVACDFKIADLSSLSESYKVAKELNNIETHIDLIIHNAGVYLTKRELTSEGFEKVFAVHYLSSFIINYQLKEKLKKQGKSRIIIVGSEGHRFAPWGLQMDDLNWDKRRYVGLMSYGSAKTAQLLSMLVFNDFFQNSGVTINTMHPGAVKSESGKENGMMYRWYKKYILDKTLKSANCSAEALYYLGVSKSLENISGKFFNLTTLEEPAPPALDKEVALELWDKTLKMIEYTAIEVKNKD